MNLSLSRKCEEGSFYWQEAFLGLTLTNIREDKND